MIGKSSLGVAPGKAIRSEAGAAASSEARSNGADAGFNTLRSHLSALRQTSCLTQFMYSRVDNVRHAVR